MPKQFQSIKSKGGLKVHLNETKDQHNGFGYSMWRFFRRIGLNNTARAKLMGVTFDTSKHWTQLDDKEQQVKKEADEAAIDELSNV